MIAKGLRVAGSTNLGHTFIAMGYINTPQNYYGFHIVKIIDLYISCTAKNKYFLFLTLYNQNDHSNS
jgi:hypothetical protein